jgi:hypothetical protein
MNPPVNVDLAMFSAQGRKSGFGCPLSNKAAIFAGLGYVGWRIGHTKRLTATKRD